MTQSMDNSPLEKPTPPREVKRRNREPSDSGKPNDPGKAHPQSGAASYRQTSGSDNTQHYSEPHTYIAQTANYGHPQSVLSMGNMVSALPNYQPSPTQFEHQAMQQQQFILGASTASNIYGMHQFQSFTGAPANANMMFNTPYPQMYMPYVQHHHQDPRLHDASPFQPLVSNSSGAPGTLIPGQVGGYGQQNLYNQNVYTATQGHALRPSNIPSSASIQRRSHPNPSVPKAPADPEKENQRRLLNLDYDVSKTIVDGSTHMRLAGAQGLSSDAGSHSTNTAKQTTSRGPPRKPKQSGHALWVGNLAPGTSIVELKDYFSQDATRAVESVFLISKSNCAFVNYKTEEACLAALSRFHDSRLRGARLVCRVRRGLMPPGPNTDLTGLSLTPSLKDGDELTPPSNTEDEGSVPTPLNIRVPNRYFIVKSLTVEDLEISRQNGIWATQTHNEETLNKAYENADNVYLIFSANKSGEYYGYARMMSPIKDDESLTLEMPPRPEHLTPEPDDLNVIPTPATSTAPNGRIINDASRGTIFWEADTSEDEEGSVHAQKSAYQAPPEEPTVEWGLHLIGKPFRIRWLSTERVPFHRTRGLRNPWNANREVKIARDGTELEPSLGEKLVLLFHPEASGQGITGE